MTTKTTDSLDTLTGSEALALYALATTGRTPDMGPDAWAALADEIERELPAAQDWARPAIADRARNCRRRAGL